MPIIRAAFLTFLLWPFPAAAADAPCGDAKEAVCGPGEVKLPFLKLLEESAPVRERAVPSPEKDLGAAPGTVKTAPPARGRPAVKAAHVLAVAAEVRLELFYTYDCPHCKKAIAWLPSLKTQYPGLVITTYEVKRSVKNRELLARRLAAAGTAPAGFPTFFAGGKQVVGFAQPRSTDEIKAALDAAYGRPGCGCQEKKEIRVPFLGSIDPASVSMLQFSFLLGLLDGLNPCAMWVLMFLMGLLAYTGSSRKMLLIGGIFTAASALVYFAFMAAWFNLFLIIGHARWITAALGVVSALMGLINLKEIFFFKRGVSLMISGKAKVTLGGKIRAIIAERDTALMVAATAALAVFVNLIELGCTIGLPAVFTRVLSVRQAGFWAKYGYMAVYNAAYIVPLALIIALFVFTMGRYRMTEAHGKLLKGISGALMLALGLLMLFKPEALIFN